jgi:hypothetical protein
MHRDECVEPGLFVTAAGYALVTFDLDIGDVHGWFLLFSGLIGLLARLRIDRGLLE